MVHRPLLVSLFAASAVLCQSVPGEANEAFNGRSEGSNYDDFSAYRDGDNVITVQKKGEDCGQAYYVQAKLARGRGSPAQDRGTLSSCTMFHCTTPKLKKECKQLGDKFSITCGGTYEEVGANPKMIKLVITYQKEFWSTLKCAPAKSELGQSTVVMLIKPRPGSPEEMDLRKKIREWEKKLNQPETKPGDDIKDILDTVGSRRR
jgi:hypothetical protein